MPGSTRISPPSPRTAMALLQTHALCRTQNAVGHLIQHGVHGSLLARRAVTGSAIGLRYRSANVTVRLAPGKVQFHAG